MNSLQMISRCCNKQKGVNGRTSIYQEALSHTREVVARSRLGTRLLSSLSPPRDVVPLPKMGFLLWSTLLQSSQAGRDRPAEKRKQGRTQKSHAQERRPKIERERHRERDRERDDRERERQSVCSPKRERLWPRQCCCSIVICCHDYALCLSHRGPDGVFSSRRLLSFAMRSPTVTFSPTSTTRVFPVESTLSLKLDSSKRIPKSFASCVTTSGL